MNTGYMHVLIDGSSSYCQLDFIDDGQIINCASAQGAHDQFEHV